MHFNIFLCEIKLESPALTLCLSVCLSTGTQSEALSLHQRLGFVCVCVHARAHVCVCKFPPLYPSTDNGRIYFNKGMKKRKEQFCGRAKGKTSFHSLNLMRVVILM